jgi:hypothetical protein
MLITSCNYSPLTPTYRFILKNVVSDSLANGFDPFETCAGGLQGNVTFLSSGVTYTTEKIALESTLDIAIEHKSRKDDSMVIEAWCFGQDGKELGYTKLVEKLSGGYPVYSIRLYPARSVPVGEDPNIYRCTGYEEERGTKNPCVFVP